MPKPLDHVSVDAVSKAALDALYVSIGLGVIAFQKAQVRRQELTKSFEEQVKDIEGRVKALLPR